MLNTNLDNYYFEIGSSYYNGNTNAFAGLGPLYGGLNAVMLVAANEYLGSGPGSLVYIAQNFPAYVNTQILGVTSLLPTVNVGPVEVGGGILSSLYFTGATPDWNYDTGTGRYNYGGTGLPAIWGYISSSLNGTVPSAAATAAAAKASVTALASVNQTGGSLIGFLVGNGANAQAGCTGSACNGRQRWPVVG